jgi:ATP-dependent helicase STH1/SNF2
LERENEEDEEDAEPDEDTLNEILARGDDERVIFAQMDEERKAAERAAGAPPRLIQLNELPEPYTRKYEAIDEARLQREADLVAGRGQRKKISINYNDEFNDVDLFGADNSDDADEAESAAKAKRRRSVTKVGREDESVSGTPQPQRKGRGAKRNLAVTDVDDGISTISDDQPRKKRRRASVGPSEDDVRPGVSRHP